MEFSNSLLSLLLFSLCVSPLSALVSAHNHEDFLKCLSHRINDNTVVSKVIHTSKGSSFCSILDSSIQNPRFSVPETPKPVSIITPVKASDVQTVIRCARLHGIHVRTRSAGHGWEGQSYIAYNKPFVVIDLRNLRSISLNVDDRTGWVQTGATTGELYFEIGKTTKSLAFPASIHPTVGVGGQFSGGGYGTLLRKYGLAADNIIDALVVDARGRILDRQAMGEDYFWAIRGGGGSSFGVVLSWKIKLVDVPSTVTVFKVQKTSEKEAVRIINKWQYVAAKVPNDLFISATLERSDKNLVHALFTGLYLGPVNDLLALMEEKFPELNLEMEDCTEMSWVESVLWFADFPKGESLGVLANRKRTSLSFKGKDDFVQEPIPEAAIQELWRRLEAPEARLAKVILTPFGGKMSEIAEHETPFPHREGNLYEIQYLAFWREEEDKNKMETEKYLKWVESVYNLMTPYVSKSPRGAYVNFMDLDLGMYLGKEETKYEEGKSWGVKYFKNNFERLVRVKTSVDPTDFFCDEQSIPILKSVDDI
ncbi:FAD-binding domain-containing protein [Arabidopsis lyrata subsp. lyrata]|uniref:FAD-binding domain-containing protein n=1 Tax=Arabidopsis lyrata subsp. lyrata TaxID=81972 RepID=D7MMH3_ARALL|nr:berberine bridge enzyme-like 28 [Arabidopsis lyrata subsp. lyrata]EFH39838.1 FAD-binding domain-containing protein [Arabidopsis lyrata subsp. lyrata]|eukprot:XP_002863579.1 berberine bridge enzyme-like 28 [Arabidopsis lyrata subsp. lyrata]